MYELWRSLANQFLLPQLAFVLKKIAKGCIGITWLIPVNLVKHITRMAQETSSEFAKNYILKVTLEEQCIYPMSTEPTIQETEAVAVKTKVCYTL